MKKDLIIGCISNYNYNNIKNWSKSIINSGYSGEKIIISYNLSSETIYKLNEDGFDIYESSLSNNIVVQRFLDSWRFIKENPKSYNRVIFTDVKDVIFQSDPSNWLDSNLGSYKMVVSSESLKYKDEGWAIHNMNESYGYEIFNYIKDWNIYNAGTIAGNSSFIENLFLIIYLLSLSGRSHNPDQAALNLLLHSNIMEGNIFYTNDEQAWACQLGTTMDPVKIDKYISNFTDDVPVIKDGYLYNKHDKKYCIVHQYDRIPTLKPIIDKRYE